MSQNKQIILYRKTATKKLFIDGKIIEILEAEITAEGKMKLTKENLISIKKFVARKNRDLFLEGKYNNEGYFFKIEEKQNVYQKNHHT